jgi:hypothetical protein
LGAKLGHIVSEVTRRKISFKRNGRIDAPNSTAQSTGRNRAQKLYPCPNGYERHHIDGNELNNEPSNVLIIKKKDHMILDGRIKNLELGRQNRLRDGKGRFL